jgi:hypothetical protein
MAILSDAINHGGRPSTAANTVVVDWMLPIFNKILAMTANHDKWTGVNIKVTIVRFQSRSGFCEKSRREPTLGSVLMVLTSRGDGKRQNCITCIECIQRK